MLVASLWRRHRHKCKRAKRARGCAEKMTVEELCSHRWDRERKRQTERQFPIYHHLSSSSERLNKKRRAVTQFAAVYTLRRHMNLEVWQPGCISTDTHKRVHAYKHTAMQMRAQPRSTWTVSAFNANWDKFGSAINIPGWSLKEGKERNCI